MSKAAQFLHTVQQQQQQHYEILQTTKCRISLVLNAIYRKCGID